jgi:hypothetical protein
MNPRALPLLVTACVLGSGCRQTYVDADNNRIPVAVARAFDAMGESVDSTVNDDLGPIYPFDGQAVEVKLDGTGSSDVDGKIVRYRWLGTSLVDGGVGFSLPEGEDSGWPDDVKQPIVMLGEGTWSFSLWVTDDAGAISDPSEIHLIVGDAPEIDKGDEK